MKKILAIILATLMIASFSACESAKESTDSNDNAENHEHSYNSDWEKDDTYHWHACKDEKCESVSSKAEHTWDDGKITTPATAQADGVKTFTCTVCNQTKTQAEKFQDENIQVSTTVTESEWKTAFELNNVTVEGYLTENGDKEDVLFKLDKTIYYSEVEGYSVWVVEKDGKFYMTDNEGTKDYEIEDFSINVGSALMSFHLPEFSKFTYDENIKAYTCINTEDYPDAFYKYNVYFENCKIVKFEACDKSANITYSFNFKDYGTTQVEPYNSFKPSGVTVQVSKAEWEAMSSVSNFDNITFITDVTFISGYSSIGPHYNVYKLDGENASADGELMNAEGVSALRTVYLETTLAIVENFEKFIYAETYKCYVSIENITYNITILGYEATITVKDAYVELDADKNLAKITCEMTQEFLENSVSKKYVLDVEFTFENYGTTVV